MSKAKYLFAKASLALWTRRAKSRLKKWRHAVATTPKGSRQRHKYHQLYMQAVNQKHVRRLQVAAGKKRWESPYKGTHLLDGVPVPLWIWDRLMKARTSGKWTGTVTSGYRTPAHQIEVGTAYAHSLGKTVAEVYPNGLTASNHCKLPTKDNPHAGAVDVTNAAQLAQALKDLDIRDLIWAGPVIGDYVHFSNNGH